MQPKLNALPGPEAIGSYARGPAAGVDYFSDTGRQVGLGNLNPGQSALNADAEAPDAGFRDLRPEVLGGNSSYDVGPAFSDAEAAGSFMSGQRGAVLGGLGQMIGSTLGAGVGAMAGPLGAMAGDKLGGNMLGTAMGAEGQFYSSPAGIFGGGSPEAQTARQFGVDLTNYTQLGAADVINASAAARADDPLGAFMVEQGILGLPQGPKDYAALSRDTGGGGGDYGMSGAESGPGESGNSAGGTSDRGEGDGGGSAFAADGGMATSDGFERPGLPERYADGGVVGSGAPLLAMGFAEGGMVPMGRMGAMSGQPNSAQVMQQVNQILRNPQMKQRLVGRAQQLMATGELTPDEVMTMARVAEAAMFNPQLYPQLRQFVAEQGLSPLPPSYDPSVIVRIMAIAKALQEAQPATPPGQVPPTQQASMESPVPGMANGGYLRGPGNGRSDSIGTVNESSGQPVKVANGEYVIPEHVVRAKGREFFDNLLRRYADVPKEQA